MRVITENTPASAVAPAAAAKAPARAVPNLLSEVVGPDAVLTRKDFKWMKILGSGQFGTVFKGKEKLTGLRNSVALKVVAKQVLDERSMVSQCRDEAEIHGRMSHVNICAFYCSFSDGINEYLVLEYAPKGTLYERLRAQKNKRFDETTAARHIAEIARALEHIHSHGVLHRDVKPENLLFDGEERLKLGDFGWATDSMTADDRCGTLDYMAPQMVSETPYGSDADVWALGVCAFEMLTGKTPFERVGEEDYRAPTMRRIIENDYVWPAKPHVSREAKHLVDSMLRHLPEDRLTIAEILRYPWITKKCKDDARYSAEVSPCVE